VRPGEVMKFSLDASRAKKIFGWQPKTSLKAGLRQTLS
jgi:nucleoside-diphosphate-sugar epimerase